MSVVSKCSKCRRTYTAPMTVCQMCGAPCVPASADDHLVVKPQSQASLPTISPKKVCPCCGGQPGNGSIALQTEKQLTNTTLMQDLRGVRKFRVTTLTFGNVCDECSRSLGIRRVIADFLFALPLLVFFGLLVVMDQKALMIPVLLYLIYMVKTLSYSWADQLLYGANLETSLGRHAPMGELGSIEFPSGILHIMLRIAAVPILAVVLAVAGTVLFGAIKLTQDKPTPETASEVKPPAPQGPAWDANPADNPNLDPLERARVYFLGAQRVYVPVTEASFKNPATITFEPQIVDIQGKSLRTIEVYDKEALVPQTVYYEETNGQGFLKQFIDSGAEAARVHGSTDWVLLRADAEKILAGIKKLMAAPLSVHKAKQLKPK